MAKLLANRFALVVDKLVSEAKTCSIPTRSIHNNFQLIRYITERLGNEVGVVGFLINLDQSNAFDSVDHEYVEADLQSTGFHPVSTGWIAALYKEIRAVVRVNGHLSKSFNIAHWVRQKCPLLSLLYVLTLE